jgi:hypothetical protein
MSLKPAPARRIDDGFFREIAKVLAYASVFAAIPVFASLQNLQPPWPTGIAHVSAAIIFLATILVWELGRGMGRKSRRRLLLLAAGLTMIGLFAYLYLYSTYVVSIEGGDRIIMGYECNAPTRAVYKDMCPNLGEMELNRAGYDPRLLFTRGSLSAVRLGLVATWLVFVAGLIAAVGWAVSGRRTPVAKAEG